MVFADPQVITIGADTYTLPRTGFGDGSGRFTFSDGGHAELRISHSKGKRNRSVVRIDMSSTIDDPLLDNVNLPISMSVQLVLDTPVYGFDATEKKDLLLGLAAFLTASSGANSSKFVGGES